jgi:hypothetical protein
MKIKNTLAIALAVGLGLSAQATPITGGLSFAGNYTPNNSDLTVATSITFGSTFVTSANGTFAIFAPGSPVAVFSPLAINPTVTPVIGLWSIGIYSFDAFSLVQSAQTATTLTLTGTGVIHNGNPQEDAAAQWIATFNTLSGTYSWSASTGTVPDASSTLMLLGGAMTGIGLIRRKLSA